MNKKSDFDIGFDKGFNAGYDLGFEKGIEKNIVQMNNSNIVLANNLLSRELFSNIVLTIDKNRFIDLFKKFVADISIKPLDCNDLFNAIIKAFNNKQSFSILSTSDLFSSNSTTGKAKDLKNIITALKNSEVLLLPSLLDSEKMFYTNSFLYSNNIFTDISLINVVADLFSSKLIKKLSGYSDFVIYDSSATHIVRYLNDNSIKATIANNSKYNNKICLVGNSKYKWSIIQSLQVNKNIIIDIQDIRVQLVNQLLPIGLK